MGDCVNSYINELEKNFPEEAITTARVTRKRSKYHREEPPIEASQRIDQIGRCEE
jgi:hypothetical protein